ncbi:MAG: RNA polymerase sigma factor [Gemmatimonadota bacterium]
MNREAEGTTHDIADPDLAEEAELIRRIAGGETHRYSVLVERHQRRLYWSCLRLLGDADEAEDVVQEAFVSAYEHLRDYDPAYRFYTWLYRIARNRCLNVIRRRKLWGLVTLSDPGRAPALPAIDRSDRSLEDGELTAALAACRSSLPADQREVFDLRHAEGFSYREIAAAAGIPEGTVMSRLARAREKMRSCLESKGVGLADG